MDILQSDSNLLLNTKRFFRVGLPVLCLPHWAHEAAPFCLTPEEPRGDKRSHGVAGSRGLHALAAYQGSQYMTALSFLGQRGAEEVPEALARLAGAWSSVARATGLECLGCGFAEPRKSGMGTEAHAIVFSWQKLRCLWARRRAAAITS